MIDAAVTPSPVRQVFMVAWWFGEFGGAEQLITDHAIALTEAGVEVAVFSEMPADGRNQYVRRLVAAEIRIVAPSALLARALQWAVPRLRLRTAIRRTHSAPSVVARVRAAAGRAPRSLASVVTRRCLTRAIGNAWTSDQDAVISVHGFGVDMAWLVPWAKACGMPVVYTEHGSIGEHGGARPRHAGRWLAAADLVFCAPGKARESLEELMPCPYAKIRPIPHIVNCGGFTPESDRAGVDADPRALRIGCVGRLVLDKGIDVLIRAFAGLATERPDIRLLLFGDGEDREALQRLAKQLNIDDLVEFRGPFEHSQIGAVMSEIDIFVLASLTEALPLAILEAMAYSKPIVASNVGGVSSVLEHGVNGLLVPAGEVSALKDALERLAGVPALRATLAAAAARTFADGGFSPGEAASKLLDYFGEATRSAAERGPDSKYETPAPPGVKGAD